MAKVSPVTVLEPTLWYKDAVIYELHVRAFYDSNGDGVGDFRGLIEKLDYFVDLGVTALWLLPFYPSPQKDDGYDIANYTDIHPSYGTLKDFKDFLKAAHRKGLKVITELVLNHTSDQHEWFQKSRRAPEGSSWRDFYVWSDGTHRYREARIIFKDFETSNWSWDPVARRYYWHRFYSHQPDLNFENPEVKVKLFEVVDFWFAMGVDGMRLDAVPYLFEKEGTSCENLEETHVFLKDLRAYIDSKYSDRMLLAEANQWPEDAVDYFGDGDECQMCFHFPLMPRLFMALKLEDRFSIIDILQQTPAIPDNCQWATFLRNHDELTLEMVTDEERDYMYNTYASDPRARINLGIRRRLAPLLGNDRRQVELLNGLLFSLSGTPVIYYGDEIGMGDNIFLGDRNGVRTPFQWTSDRNAGFSKADPQQLYLPVIFAPEFYYATINVENQQNNSHSLLWWMKNLVSIRKQFTCLSQGGLEFLHPDNPKVLSYIRSHQDQCVMVVANLSRRAQCVELDLARFKGYVPVELFGRVDFPPIGTLPYFITLSPYAFYWFMLKPQDKDLVREEELEGAKTRKARILDFTGRPLDALRKEEVQAVIEPDLKAYLYQMRWFAGKGRVVDSCILEDIVPLESAKDASRYVLIVTRVLFQDGAPERYMLTVGFAEGEIADRIKNEHPQHVISLVQRRGVSKGVGLYYDAAIDIEFYQDLLQFILRRRSVKTGQASTNSQVYVPVKKAWLTSPPKPKFRAHDQSNTSILFEQDFFLKLYRRLEPGLHPEVEISRHLAEVRDFHGSPDLIASIKYSDRSRTYSLGLLENYIQNEGDAWKLTVNYLTQALDELVATPIDNSIDEHPPTLSIFERMGMTPPPAIKERCEYYFNLISLLGERVAQLHIALASEDISAEFSPEDFTPFYQRALYQSLRNSTARTFKTLKVASNKMEKPMQLLALEVLQRQGEVSSILKKLLEEPLKAKRIRCHGDLHLGQVLFTGKDFIILDFEGEPSRSIGERKLKRPVLRDVAGLLRSIDYAMFYILKSNTFRQEDIDKVKNFLHIWALWSKSEFFKAYYLHIGSKDLLPSNHKDLATLSEIYLLDKVLYEISYELNNRPGWVDIPLHGFINFLDGNW